MDYPNPNVNPRPASILYPSKCWIISLQSFCIQEWKINFNISLGEKQLRKKNRGNYKAFQSQL